MEYIYYFTNAKQYWWNKQDFSAEFSKLREQFEKSHYEIRDYKGDSTCIVDKLWITRITGKHGRPTFVWLQKVENDVCYYVFREAMNHDEYRKKITEKTKISYRQQQELTHDEEEEIRKHYQALIDERNKIPHEEKPSMTDNERLFISQSLSINCDLFRDAIFETREWVDDIVSSEDEDKFDEFSEAAQKILAYIFDHDNHPDGWGEIIVKERCILIYHRNENWILVAAPSKEDREKIEKIKSEDIPSDYLRGYPYTFLDSEDEWRRMEKDVKSNLVLTKQQVEVVANSSINYPLFISGRAGSGKSTVLQYLFAEIVLRYLITRNACEGEKLLPPVYLSYSKTLIDDAMRLSNTLFDKNSVYKDAMSKHKLDYKKDVSPELNGMFYVFKKLVKNCISKYNQEILQSRFSDDMYISFAIFKRKWNQRFGKDRDAIKNYGPSISWHIIRTYIKGWDSTKYLSPEDYDILGRNYRTVSSLTFQKVYSEVWDKWYKGLTSERHWDDQDLVKYCLSNKYADEQFSAIYCDESQDFTRLEIDFILKISTFANRNIENVDDISKLPFVFAGDEFQTLNPTGFSWDSLRGYFVDRIFEMTGLGNKKDDSNLPKPIEFNENFRSTSQIVKLANRIQLLRASRFDEYSTPQTPHFSVEGPSIYCVSPTNDHSLWDKIQGNLVNLIVPIAEGESVEEYIKNSPLRDKINFEDGIPQGLTILSPSQAKGCEYANVLIYGFNTSSENEEFKISNLQEWFNNPQRDVEKDIELKYQICNAYVAVTRATSRIFILDEYNMNSFWAFAFNDSDVKNRRMINRLEGSMIKHLGSKSEVWSQDNILGWIEGHPSDGISFEAMNKRSIQEELEKNRKNAEIREDAGMMRMVAFRYKERNHLEKFAECMAKAYVFENNMLEAAKFYEKAKKYDFALDAYWKELGNTSTPETIINKVGTLKGYIDDKRLVNCIRANGNVTIKTFKEILADFKIDIDSDNVNINAWQNLVNYSMGKLEDVKEWNDNKDIGVVIKLIKELSAKSIKIDSNRLAEISYKFEDYVNAISLWESSDGELPTTYYLSKYRSLGYPEYLDFAYKCGMDEKSHDIVEDYIRNKNVKLSESRMSVVLSALRQVNSHKEEYRKRLPQMLRMAKDKAELVSLIDNVNKHDIGMFNKEAVEHVFYVKNGEYESIKIPVKEYAKPETRLFHEAIRLIKEMQTKEYRKRLNVWFDGSQAKLTDCVSNAINLYIGTPYLPLVVFELGRTIEMRDKKLDAVKYYEAVKSLVNVKDIKDQCDIRWIVCKERQGRITSSNQYMEEAKSKRKEKNIEPEMSLPEYPSLNEGQWESLFEKSINIDLEEVRPVVSKPSPSIEKERVKTPSKPLSNAKQELTYKDYSLRYFPQRHEIRIERNTDEYDYTLIIKNGEISDNPEFHVKDGRIFLTDIDEATPFGIRKDDTHLWIEIFDGEKETGLSILSLIK